MQNAAALDMFLRLQFCATFGPFFKGHCFSGVLHELYKVAEEVQRCQANNFSSQTPNAMKDKSKDFLALKTAFSEEWEKFIKSPKIELGPFSFSTSLARNPSIMEMKSSLDRDMLRKAIAKYLKKSIVKEGEGLE